MPATEERQPDAVRRVVAGTDEHGLSTVVDDGPVSTMVWRPDGSVVMDVWRFDSLPALLGDGDGLDGTVSAPLPGGLVYRTMWVAPQSQEQAQASARVRATGADPPAIPGAHRTDTVDVVTVVSGEVYAVFDTGETLLRPGDSLVQRGTRHAWHNRSATPALIVSIMVAAAPPP